jgi:putative tryptophan/tyrosine transport system substrate-binding protein
MKRRDFITLLGGAAAAWQIEARAQQPDRMRRIGVLLGAADDPEGQARVMALKQALRELGWADGRNIQIDTRFAGADVNLIRTDAAELVALGPDAIVASTTPVIQALREATSSVPIVFAALNDPVDQGFISSLAHPGGNITGLALIEFTMVGKWLEMLKEVSPVVGRAALIFNPNTGPYYYVYLRSLEAVPRSFAIKVTAAPVRDTAEIEETIAKIGRERGSGLIVPPDPFHHRPPRIDHEVGDAPRATRRVRVPVVRREGRLDVVRTRPVRPVPALSFLCRSHIKGGEACGPARPAADQVRACDQPQNRQNPRPRIAPNAARPRRRGD